MTSEIEYRSCGCGGDRGAWSMAAVLPPPASSTTSAPIYGFGGSEIGETLASWRAAKPPRVSIVCAQETRNAVAETCRGADIALGGGFFARNVDYTFVDGRLARIAFRSSIDAFDYVTAALKRR